MYNGKGKVLLLVLQSQDLRVGQEKKPCIGFTQENLIENFVQDCLPYILKSHMLSSQMVDLVSFYFIFHFHFHFVLFSYFSIFKT